MGEVYITLQDGSTRGDQEVGGTHTDIEGRARGLSMWRVPEPAYHLSPHLSVWTIYRVAQTQIRIWASALSDQERQLAVINAAISANMLQSPFIVTKVVLLR